MSVHDHFTRQELDAIRAVTQEAEHQTGGELVCVIVNRCDTYLAPIWQAAALGAVAGTAFAGLWVGVSEVWLTAPLLWILLPPILGSAAGLLSVWALRSLRRWLIPPQVLERRVDRRAAAAFLDEEIFNTRDRTGVLLFVALFEHQIRILADRGVEERVPEESWQEIADELTGGLRRGEPGAAIVRAITKCRDLLAEYRVTRREDDQNELLDEPRLIDE